MMDNLFVKSLWSAIGAYFLLTFSFAQDIRTHTLPVRRRLPAVIITREHLRQRPTLYGAYGDTAAEFVVSAGLDTSKSTAVRIRRLGNRGNTNGTTFSAKPVGDRVDHSGRPSGNRPPISNYPELQYRNPVLLNEADRRLSNIFPQIINRRNHLNEGDQRFRNPNPEFFHNPHHRVFGRPYQPYRPPLPDINYQQNRRTNVHSFRPNAEVTNSENPPYSRQGPPLNSYGQRSKPPVNHNINLNTRSDVVNRNHSDAPQKEEDEKLNPIPDNERISVGNQDDNGPSPDMEKNIVAETPPLRLNDVKFHNVQNNIIRKPPLVLKDQITVNEVALRSDGPRYGPRSLPLNENYEAKVRRRRQVYNYEIGRPKRSNVTRNGSVSSTANRAKGSNWDVAFEINPFRAYEILRTHKNYHSDVSKNNSDNTSMEHLTRRFSDLHQPSNQTSRFINILNFTSDNEGNSSESSAFYHDDYFSDSNSDVMSFSEFLASPIADKIRLDRQFLLRNSTGKENATRESSSSGYDSGILLQNTTGAELRNIIVSRLLHGMLNIGNSSTNISASSEDSPKSRSSSGTMASAEQRQFGILVSPYDGPGNPKSVPVIRVLKGKLVPLPDLPQELIPIILGTYKPVQTTHAPYNGEDSKLTESILDNAIFSLLQNEDIMNLVTMRPKVAPVGLRVNRKSPSTNYVGSLKQSEPLSQSSYPYKASEWSLGPRCDRLTDEICLEDSDYPSSAIMSSIYKDKTKFDLMYAELKVRESQVEGLSRQQEQGYTFDHYYGPYQQMAGSSLVPRDYGPNGGFVCPSEIHYGRPHRAKNRKGEWKVVVNVGEYTQTVRMEKCLASGNPCKYVVSHMQSTCSQVYSYHRLLVFSKEQGLHIDVFRIPTACSCHMRNMGYGYSPAYSASTSYMQRPNTYEEFGGHVETAPEPLQSDGTKNVNKDKKNSFSSTLWAILGGGQQASVLAQQPQFLDEVQKQITWTQQLKQFPQLIKQISPNQVLKQLLDEDEDDYSIRRQRIRLKPANDLVTSGGFASHQLPIAVPLPPPPPPPKVIPRRPIISAVPVDQKVFGLTPKAPSQVITMSSSEPSKILSFSKDRQPGPKVVRIINAKGGQRNVFEIVPATAFKRMNAFKIQPGMYPPNSEKIQVSEASMLPIAPQFADHALAEGGFRPVLKPMPAPKGSNKDLVDDEDLIAVEKSAGDDAMETTFHIELTSTEKSEETSDSNDSKINFSYHPILEYLNL